MNHSRKLAAVVLGAASVFTMSSAFAAGMQTIAESWHNLGALNSKGATPNGGTPANHSTNTSEICVFCHTPHGGDNTAAVPIWNRKLNAPSAYKRYSSLGTATFDATEAPVGSVTIACLSCHDGTQAIDSVINRPGSGGYNTAGQQIGNMAGADVDASGKLAAGIVQNLGTDLSNDHPVSMQYGGGGISVANANAATVDYDFTNATRPNTAQSAKMMSMAAPPSSGLGTLWWIERSTSLRADVRDRTDIILYTRNDVTGDATMQPTVECGSCHDPHNVDNPTFLRVANIGDGTNPDYPNSKGGPSALCLTCHLK